MKTAYSPALLNSSVDNSSLSQKKQLSDAELDAIIFGDNSQQYGDSLSRRLSSIDKIIAESSTINTNLTRRAPYTSIQTNYNDTPQGNILTPNTELVIDVQQDLAFLGYYDRSIDGIYGTRTKLAVKTFERDNDQVVDGVLDWYFLESLHVAAGVKSVKLSGCQTVNNLDDWDKVTEIKDKNKAKKNANIFTKDSPKSLVFKLQGLPDSVTLHQTYEILHYDFSYVKVSLKKGKVLDWHNTSGNLKVMK